MVLLVAAAAGFSSSAAPYQSGSRARVEAKVLRQMEGNGRASFWIVMREQADLSRAPRIRNWGARGWFVFHRLNKVANRSQARVRSDLAAAGVSYRPFWGVNAIYVKSARRDVLDATAALPEVKEILATRLPNSAPRVPRSVAVHEREPARTQTVEWNVAAIRAPEVWSSFNDRGDGIVVANIGSGVRWTHNALKSHYRGWNGTTANHNYNWFLASSDGCTPPREPCDTSGHETHTMGTMVGDDGKPGPNQIGVAPHAKWIAANTCCTEDGGVRAMEWMLAPKDLNGQNPRPDLRPHVINNSWTIPPSQDGLYRPIVQNWVMAGMFPVFAIGNSGRAAMGDMPRTRPAFSPSTPRVELTVRPNPSHYGDSVAFGWESFGLGPLAVCDDNVGWVVHQPFRGSVTKTAGVDFDRSFLWIVECQYQEISATGSIDVDYPCRSAEPPGAYPESEGVGAFDRYGALYQQSSRGPATYDGVNVIKPNIVAPGVDVRSSWYTGDSVYQGGALGTGTSQAAPHVAATVALMWSAAHGLIGNIAMTKYLLHITAVDQSDLSCGGTAGNNNVWGEGKLDAYAAVQKALALPAR